MDPNATMDRILDLFKDVDHDELQDCCANLYDWLENGGFPPKDFSRYNAHEFVVNLAAISRKVQRVQEQRL